MAINTKHPWEKNPILSRTLTSKEDFEIVNKKALANLAPEVKGEHMFKALIALKFSRESYNHKKDNLMDGVAYIQGLENYINEKK